MKTLIQNLRIVAAFCVAMLMAPLASASPCFWLAVNGASADTNWSTTANWSETPVSDAANFSGFTAVSGPGITTVNVDGAYGTPGTGSAASYGAFFGQTNGYHRVFIQ